MVSDRRKPPDGHGRLSWNSVAADGFDFPRDNPAGPKKQVSAAPPDFDPAACPIIAKHFFGTEPLRTISDVADLVGADLKRQRQVTRLHSLGPRPVLEALIEVAAGAELDTVLADYARLNLAVVTALGGDKFPPSIFAVGST